MPKGGRSTLQFKDDDWRMSFIMGNYITLTNVDETEFQRILDRRVSPLFISVHATDPAVRVKMMRNPSAGLLPERLVKLRDANLRFHCQIVCCPGINDGEVLDKTLFDLAAFMPAAQSLRLYGGAHEISGRIIPLTDIYAGGSQTRTAAGTGVANTASAKLIPLLCLPRMN